MHINDENNLPEFPLRMSECSERGLRKKKRQEIKDSIFTQFERVLFICMKLLALPAEAKDKAPAIDYRKRKELHTILSYKATNEKLLPFESFSAD